MHAKISLGSELVMTDSGTLESEQPIQRVCKITTKIHRELI